MPGTRFNFTKGIDVSDYNKLKKVAQGSLESLTESNGRVLMPQNNSLDKDQISLFKLWVENGAKEKADPIQNEESENEKTDDVVSKPTDTQSKGLLSKEFFKSEIYEIKKEYLKDRDSVEITNIKLKINAAGKSEEFKTEEID